MPELPDINLYIEALRPRIVGKTLAHVTIKSPFLLRTFDPPIDAVIGQRVSSIGRLGKRIVLNFDNDLALVFHLMIAGRFQWKPPGAKPTGKIDLAAFSFEDGTLTLTEASPKKRASLHVVSNKPGAAGPDAGKSAKSSSTGLESLASHDPGGLEPLDCTPKQFTAALKKQNRTIKRALTDPAILSGIGNAYSDEILFDAKMSPVRLTGSMTDEEFARLYTSTQGTLGKWIETLRHEFGLDTGGPGRFPGPGAITAFRPDFAVHGRYGKPCRVCGSPIQRIIRGDHETNYCPTCQTAGKILADRSLSRLLKDDWPTSVEEWEKVIGDKK